MDKFLELEKLFKKLQTKIKKLIGYVSVLLVEQEKKYKLVTYEMALFKSAVDKN